MSDLVVDLFLDFYVIYSFCLNREVVCVNINTTKMRLFGAVDIRVIFDD
jgi:hypothetical protein